MWSLYLIVGGMVERCQVTNVIQRMVQLTYFYPLAPAPRPRSGSGPPASGSNYVTLEAHPVGTAIALTSHFVSLLQSSHSSAA